jgi:Tol biopolymer transport system component
MMEMITGQQVFAGETVSDILASVLKSEPDWDQLPASTPRPIRRLLRRCLRKDPDTRLHHPADARIEIEAAQSSPDAVEVAGQTAATLPVEPTWKRALPWVLAPIAMIALLTLAVRETSRPQPPDPVPYRFDMSIGGFGSRSWVPLLSPDGRRFAYIAQTEGGPALHVQSFDGPAARRLDAFVPTGTYMWSPDGESLAFFLEETLEHIRVDGGTPRTMCRVPRGFRTGSWSSSGTVLVEVTGNEDEGGWYLCRPGSPAAEKFERPLKLESGQTRSYPMFLPDGEHYVFIHHVDGVRQAVLAKLGSSDATLMFPTDTKVKVAGDGWYMFSRDGQLLARPFDRSSFLPIGEPVKVADRVWMFEPNGRAAFSVSNQGTVMYRTGDRISELVWFDQDGRELGPALEAGEYDQAELSPDGRLLALVVNDPRSGTGELWSHNLERGVANRLTDTQWSEFTPRWSPDGTEIVFSADQHGPPNLFIISADGGEPRELVPPDQQIHYPTDWLDDGKIVFERSSVETDYDLWAIDAAGGEAQALIRTDDAESDGVVSPDGRWLAYTSSDSGSSEVYLQPYGRSGGRQRISIVGGWYPRWDGNDRLFFRSVEETLMAVSLRPDGRRLAIGKPETIITFLDGDMGSFGLHPDGRILVTRHSGRADVTEVKVILNWD